MHNAHVPEQLSEGWVAMQNAVVSKDGKRINFYGGDEPKHLKQGRLAAVTDAVVVSLLHDKNYVDQLRRLR